MIRSNFLVGFKTSITKTWHRKINKYNWSTNFMLDFMIRSDDSDKIFTKF